MSDKSTEEKDGLPELIKKVWLPVAGFLGAVTLAYNFYQLWLGDQATITFIIAGSGLFLLIVVLGWIGFGYHITIQKKQKRKEPQYTKKYRWSARALLAVVLVGMGYSTWLLFEHRKEEKENFVIVIAKFEGPEEIYGLRNEIIEQISSDLTPSSTIKIKPVDEVVTPEHGSEYAKQLGEKYLADIVLWAWYRPTQKANIVIHIENLSPGQISGLHDSTTCRLSASIGDLETFTFQFQLSNETSAMINYWAGLIAFEGKDYNSAVTRFTKSIENKTTELTSLPIDLASIYFYRADSYRYLEEYKNAIADFDTFIGMNPEHYCAHYDRGYSYAMMEKYNEAIADYEKAVEIDPKYSATYINLGNAYESLKDYKTALEFYNKALEISPQDAAAYNGRGVVYAEMQKFDLAIADFTKAIDIAPEDYFSYSNLGHVYELQGKYQEALQEYDQAITLRPEDADLYSRRAGIYLELSNQTEASKDLDKALELDKQNTLAYFNYGTIYANKQDYQTAISFFTKSIEFDPQSPVSYYLRGKMYFSLKNYKAAILDYDKAILLNPESAEFYANRASSYYLLGNTKEAEADLQKYKELTGQDAP